MYSWNDENILARKHFRTQSGVRVNAPILSDGPGNIECMLVDHVVTGLHKVIAGKVGYVHADEKLIDGKHKTEFSQVKFIQEEYHWDDKERHNNR